VRLNANEDIDVFRSLSLNVRVNFRDAPIRLRDCYIGENMSALNRESKRTSEEKRRVGPRPALMTGRAALVRLVTAALRQSWQAERERERETEKDGVTLTAHTESLWFAIDSFS